METELLLRPSICFSVFVVWLTSVISHERETKETVVQKKKRRIFLVLNCLSNLINNPGCLTQVNCSVC